MALLVSGSALAQAINIAATPILSRLYSPEQFGILGTILAIAGPITVIAALKYEQAIVLEEKDELADDLKKLSVLILFTVSVLTCLGLTGYFIFSKFFVFESKGAILWWIVVFIFSGSLLEILRHSLNRKRMYRIIATSKAVGQIAGSGFNIILGLLIGGTAGFLIFGNALIYIVPIAYILFKDKPTWFFNKENLIPVAKKHFRFPLYSAPQNFLNAVSQNLPIYMLGSFFGLEIVGLYWFAMRIIQLPTSLVGESVRQVFYKEASDMKDNPIRLRRFFIKMTGGLFSIVVVPVIVVFIWGPEIFRFIFGKEWAVSGEYAKWMFLWVGLLFINPPSISMFNILNLQKYSLFFDILLLSLRASALFVGGLFFSALQTIIFFSLAGLIFNVFIILFIYNKLKKRGVVVEQIE